MTNTVAISVAEYLSSPAYERFEYEAGVVTEKRMPNWLHGELCVWICALLIKLYPQFKPGTEVRARLSPERWRLPDITVVYRGCSRERYSYEPSHLCIEVLSEGDSVQELTAKCRLYNDWGVPYCWVIDGENRRAWQVNKNEGLREVETELVAGTICLSLESIFSCLNADFSPDL